MTKETDPTTGLNAAVAEVLNGERVAAGMTYDDLAGVTGLGKRTLLRYLSSKSRNIDLDVIERMAEVFRTTPVQILASAAERMNRPAVPDEAAYKAIRTGLPDAGPRQVSPLVEKPKRSRKKA